MEGILFVVVGRMIRGFDNHILFVLVDTKGIHHVDNFQIFFAAAKEIIVGVSLKEFTHNMLRLTRGSFAQESL